MNGTATVAGVPLSGAQGYAYTSGCTITGGPGNTTFSHLLSIVGAATRYNYLAFNYFVAPFILTWLPVANIKATKSITVSNSEMLCLRAKNVHAGSETVPPAGSPTPINLGGGGLSGGAIAGIVIGVVIALALVILAAWWFWRRSKKAKKQITNDGEYPVYSQDAKERPSHMVEVSGDVQINELSPDNEMRPELAGDPRAPQEKPVDMEPAGLQVLK